VTRAIPETQISDDTIRTNTGHGWREWVEILDAWGAPDKSHTDIARHVHSLGVSEWWSQGVTVQYERIIGRRVVGQRSVGSYSGSASKTIAADVDVLDQAFTNDEVRAAWLEPDTLSLRSASPGKSARFDQTDSPGILAITYSPKGPGKTAVQVQQEGLTSKEAADAFRARWKDRLGDLIRYLAG